MYAAPNAPSPDDADAARREGHRRRASRALVTCLVLAFASAAAWFVSLTRMRDFGWVVLFTLLALAQLVAGLVAIVTGFLARPRGGSLAQPALGFLGVLGAIVGWVLGFGFFALAAMGAGGAWGRPLRVRGRQRHPELRLGSDWTAGALPDPSGLDDATRALLEALWLHDAQKEHASVPAFARISWMLAAVGAPPSLHRGAQQAALEEIEHAERCFALAAGYGGRRHTVEPMPDLTLVGTGAVDDPLFTLVHESVTDGILLEGFNADVAARCAATCEEPVTRAVLAQIAREERSHAAFSRDVVAWVAERHPARAQAAMEKALRDLAAYARPTAVRRDLLGLAARADEDALRRHGRLPDAEWAAAWDARLEETEREIGALLPARASAA